MSNQTLKASFALLLITGFIASITGCSFFYKKLPPAPKEKPATALDMVLTALSLERQDLGINRPLPRNDPFLLHKVPLFLNSPIQINSFSRQCETALNREPRSLASLVAFAADVMELKIANGSEQLETAACKECENLPAALRDAVEVIYSSLPRTKTLFEEAFKELTAEEQLFIKKIFTQLLLPGAPDAHLTRRQEQDLNEKALSLAARVNRQKMLAGALIVSKSIDRALTILSPENISLIKAQLPREKTIINTPLGEIIIGGPGNNDYTGTMPVLLLEVGGNDHYHFTNYNPLSVIIDLSGNDTYESRGNASCGAGIMGMGFLIDRAGDDQYSEQNSSFGAGFFGVGVLLDEKGNDVYTSRTLAEGAGAFGLGILCDWQGNDVYQGAMYSQGFGFTNGCGLFIDYTGNDKVLSRGAIADFREKNGAYQTCSQGFGQGFRGFAAGGIGILYNGEGDDIYEGSYFCQGSSYWLSIGMLIDNKGNDTYQARRYSQGAGVHSSIGALLDRMGNDTYKSWAVSQGCGHDRSIGMLWDNQGNDRYSAEWLSQGSGNDSGRGLLIDEYGDDTYTTGMQGTQGCGIFDTRRDESSIGILIDGSGRDTFKGNGKSNKAWTCGKIGGGIDADGRMPAIWEEQWLKTDVSNAECRFRNTECVTRGKHSSLKSQMKSAIVPELEQPLITEDLWEKAAEKLAGKGPAIIPALVQYLGIKDVLVSRTLEETFKKIGKKNVADIHNLVQQQDIGSSKKTFLLYVLGDIANPQSKDLFLKLLKAKDTKVQAMSLRGLYKLKICPPIKDAKRLAKSDNMDVRKYLALSLHPCEGKGAVIPLLVKLQRDKDFNVRYATAEAIKQ